MVSQNDNGTNVVQDDGTYQFSSNLAFADQQERMIQAPAGAFINALVAMGISKKTALDLINKDLTGYNFATSFPRVTRWQPGVAKYIPPFYANCEQWSNMDPTLYIDPISGEISPNPPSESIFTDPNYASPAAGQWEFHIGPPAACKVTITPAWADSINASLIELLDATDTWVQRHRVFDTPRGTLRALQGNKWPGYRAAYSMMNQAVAVIFNVYGNAADTLLGIMPTNPNMAATINPEDYSAVPYDGIPAHFIAYRNQVAKEWVDRQFACAALGVAIVQTCVITGQLIGMYDVLSPSPVDPPLKADLMTGDCAHPMGHFPTILQTLEGRMCKGDRPFVLHNDPNAPNAEFQKGIDYKGIPEVESDVGVDPDMLDRTYDEYSARVGCYAALDKNHMVVISIDVDGNGMGSKFGAVLRPWESSPGVKAYPQITGANPDWDLQNAFDTGVCTGIQIQNLAKNGVLNDPALRALLIEKPSPAALKVFLQFPNAQILLDAFNGKLTGTSAPAPSPVINTPQTSQPLHT